MKALDYVRVDDLLPDQTAQTGQAAGPLNLSGLIGTWYSTDKQATGIIRMEFTQHDGTLYVHAFGADRDEPYDWGEVEATPYGANVTDTNAMAFTAMYDFGFLVTILSAYNKYGLLVLDSFNTFTDSSGRSNYFTREFFHQCQ